MRRPFAAFVVTAAMLLWCRVASAEQVLNLELSGGVGVTAFNEATESALSPPFLQVQVAYLPLRVGPVSMGPALGIPLGFYQPEGQDSWQPQVGFRTGWQVFGRPSVDFAWMALAAVDFIIAPLDDESDPVDFVWGFEVGGSVAYFLTAGLAVTGGLRYAFFYGVDPIHTFSGQLGLMISYEVNP